MPLNAPGAPVSPFGGGLTRRRGLLLIGGLALAGAAAWLLVRRSPAQASASAGHVHAATGDSNKAMPVQRATRPGSV